MSRRRIPDAVLSAAHARARARETDDWAEADRLRAEIEAAGWRIVDRGTDFALTPGVPPDVTDGSRIRYGSSLSVPSRLGDPAVGLATVVMIATGPPDDPARALEGLGAGSPDGTSVVIVADGPSPEQTAALDALETQASSRFPVEVVWTSERLGYGAATNIGVRRAAGPVIVLLDTSLEPSGDVLTPLVNALDDITVAVAGGWGIVSADLRRFSGASAGDVDAFEGSLQAFRRSDYPERGPFDERFRSRRNLAIWWSLVLRDEGQGTPPRRAVSLAGLPIDRRDSREEAGLGDAERDRQAKRDFYRLIDRFGPRLDLVSGAATDPRRG